MALSNTRLVETPGVVLIGSGIMSANLGAILKRLDPALKIHLFEVTKEVAQVPTMAVPPAEDWRLVEADIRVQAIKREDGEAGIVHNGTE